MEGVINHGFLSDLHGPVRTIHKVICNGINSRQFTCVNEYETKPTENIKTFNSRGQFVSFGRFNVQDVALIQAFPRYLSENICASDSSSLTLQLTANAPVL